MNVNLPMAPDRQGGMYFLNFRPLQKKEQKKKNSNGDKSRNDSDAYLFFVFEDG